MKDKPLSALVIGDDTRSFLGIVRSLGQKGVIVDAAPYDCSSTALTSRYLRNFIRLPNYSLEPNRWLSALTEAVEEYGYDMVIPCDDRAILPLIKHEAELPKCHYALPNQRAFDVFFDKARTRKVAADLGVPIAEGRLLRDSDTDADALCAEIALPVAIKPRKSYELENTGSRQNVEIVHDQEKLQEILDDIPNKSAYIIERLFPGYGIGISILANKGKISLAFQHGRVQEPFTGGGSSYRVSRPLSAPMLKCVIDLTRDTELDGVAMFEFRYDPYIDEFILLEVNARFWGSLPLAIFAGVDFPYSLFNQIISKKVPLNTGYRTGVYGRNVSADFFTIMKNISFYREQGQYWALSRYILRSLLSWMTVLIGRERHDCFAWHDLKPALAEYRSLIRLLGLGASKRLGLHSRFRRRTVRATLDRLQKRKDDIRNVVILCYGNICRSPFAERALVRALNGKSGLNIVSSGFHPVNGRCSPDDARTAAEELEIDLTPHRSSYIRDDQLENADLIILFDEKNDLSMASRGVSTSATILRLGDLLDQKGEAGQIHDPYGKGLPAFQKAYGEILDAVGRLAQVLK